MNFSDPHVLKLLQAIKGQYALDWQGIHGISHWARVWENARAYIGSVEDANIVKLSRLKSQISYLSYPGFDKKPHPILRSSLIVSLSNLRVRYYDYTESENPAILHRKEEFVGDDYPGKSKFQKLTRQEERRGLFDDTAIIGTQDRWDALLTEKGVRLAGHRLVGK